MDIPTQQPSRNYNKRVVIISVVIGAIVILLATLVAAWFVVRSDDNTKPGSYVTPGSCVDTDHGKHYYTFGSVTHNAKQAQDVCLDAAKLEEVYCGDGKIEKTIFTCSDGCQNGRCLGANSSSSPIEPNGAGMVSSGGDPFGIHFVQRHDPNIIVAEHVAALGVGMVRYDIVLDELNFAETDLIFDMIDDDVTVLFTIHNSRSFPRYWEDEADFRGLIESIAKRYHTRVAYWQIGNEVYGGPSSHWYGTKEQYVVNLNTAYEAIKSVDPNAVVVPAGIATGILSDPDGLSDLPDPSTVSDFVDAPALFSDAEYDAMEREAEEFIAYTWTHGQFDQAVFDIHIYDAPEAITVRVPWLYGELSKYSLSGDVIVTETASLDLRIYGKVNPFTQAEADEIQASDLIKRYMYIVDTGAVAGMWQGMYKPHQATDKSIAGGLVIGEDEHKRPAYYTFEILRDSLVGFTSYEKLAGNTYKFIVDDSPVMVVWSDNAAMLDVSTHFETSVVTANHIVTALDTAGEPVFAAAEVFEPTAVPIGPTPIIIK